MKYPTSFFLFLSKRLSVLDYKCPYQTRNACNLHVCIVSSIPAVPFLFLNNLVTLLLVLTPFSTLLPCAISYIKYSTIVIKNVNKKRMIHHLWCFRKCIICVISP